MSHPPPARKRRLRPPFRALCLGACLIPSALHAEAPDYSVGGGTPYASVRGWTVVQSRDFGCSAYPEAMPVVFNAPPAGGWQLIFPYDGPDGEYQGSIDVDRYRFSETYFGEAGWMYSSFPLNLRSSVAEGDRLSARIGPMTADLALDGTRAALLKVEECWQDLTGWSATTSDRAGTFAFSGD